MSRDNNVPETPYKGLIPYYEEDAEFFFGREREQEIITDNLLASRLTLLYGTTGVGKSSVLQAGVSHHLRELAKENLAEYDTPEFVVAVFRSWRDDPLDSLAGRITESVDLVFKGQSFEPVQPSRSLVKTLQAWTERADVDLLIILDQFEEYFLYHPQEDGEGTFAVEFPRAVNHPDLRANFLISIREDSLAKLDRFKGRIPNLFDNYLRIEHLSHEAARTAIEGPINQYNRMGAPKGPQVDIEPELVEAILQQVQTGEFAVGEVGRGVVQAEADASTTEGQIETPYLQLVMTRLWNKEMEQNSHVLRWQTLDDLGGAERIVRTHLDDVMGTLSDGEREICASMFHFLVTPSGAKIAHSVTDLVAYAKLEENQVEPVLDKLSSPAIRILRPVAPALDQPDKPRYEIFHDVLAPSILDWRTRHVRTREQEEAERQAEEQKRRADELQKLVEKAEQQARLASARELAAAAINNLNVDPELSILLAMHALSVTYTLEAEEALHRAVQASRVRLTFSGHTNRIYGVAFSPDGMRIATASQDGTAKVWDAVSGREALTLSGHTAGVGGIAFSPDGTRIATASQDGTAKVWDAASGRQLLTVSGHTAEVWAIAFSPDGTCITTAGDDRVAKVWDAVSGKELLTLSGHTAGVGGIAFSPDETRIATAGHDYTARVWDAASGRELLTLSGHANSVSSVAFNRDGTRLVTASSDRIAKVWDVSSGEYLLSLSGHSHALSDVAFSPVEARVVTASWDGRAKV